MVARDDDDAWSRDRGPRYDGATDPRRAAAGRRARVLRRRRDARARTSGFREHLARQRHRRRRLARAVPGRGCAALPGAVGRRAAGRVRRLPCRAARTRSIPSSARSCAAARSTRPSTRSPRCSGCRNSRRRSAGCGSTMDVLVVPTIGTTFTVDEVLARPIDCNTMLGHYTHFGNLLDLLGCRRPARRHRRRPAVQRDAARRRAHRRHRAATRRADPRRTPRGPRRRVRRPRPPLTSEESA